MKRPFRHWVSIAKCGSCPLWLSLALLGCSASEDLTESDGVRGELRVLIADYDQSRSERIYRLTLDDGEMLDLVFDGVSAPEANSEVVVYGTREGSQLRVHAFDVVEPRRERAALRRELPRQVAMKTAFLIGDSSYSVETGRQRLLEDPDGANGLYSESSWGQWTIEGDAYGPYSIGGGCEYAGLMSSAKSDAEGAGVDIDSFDNVMLYLPKSAGCSWGGLGELGTVPAQGFRNGKDTWYSAWDACIVLNQELGHNYGMLHSHTCGWSGGKCSNADEYGDQYTPMGYGCGHLNAVEMGLMDFFNKGCNTITVEGGTAEVEIAAITTKCEGPLTVRVPSGGGFVYAEYRKEGASKHDEKSPNSIFLHWGPEYDGSTVEPYVIEQGGDQYFTSGSSDLSGSDVKFTINGALGGETAKLTVTAGGTGTATVKCLDGSTPPMPFTCTGTGTGGMGGTSGTGGTSGMGGDAGTGGMGGDAGTGAVSGMGGSAGMGGTGGTGGTGTGGTGTGGTGTGGTGAVGGAGGNGGAGGGGGAGAAGAGGTGVAGTGATGDGTPVTTDPGCGCQVPGTRSNSEALTALIGLGLLARTSARRRRRSSSG